MNWLAFFSSIVDSLALPAVVFFVIWVFHEKIGMLLPRLTRFKHNNTEIEFSEGVKELEENVVHAEVLEADIAPTDRSDHREILLKIADLSPRAAIVEAWLKVEVAAAEAAIRAYPELEAYQLRGPAQPLRMLEGKVLSKDETQQLSQLRRLRNMAAHSEEFDLDGHPVEAYIDIAITMANRLRKYGVDE